MLFSLSLLFFAMLLTGISQVLLKRGAGKNVGRAEVGFLVPYLNWFTICAYCLLLLTTILVIIALRVIPLKLVYAISSLNFVVVVGLSWLFFKEEVSNRMHIGIGLIVIGIIVFNL